MIRLSLPAGTPFALMPFVLAGAFAMTTADAAAAKGVRYNCGNGPQMTVIYQGSSLRYVYDGPDSAMRTMHTYKGNKRHFKDGANSITLEPDRNTVDYREGNDFYDRCKAFQRF